MLPTYRDIKSNLYFYLEKLINKTTNENFFPKTDLYETADYFTMFQYAPYMLMQFPDLIDKVRTNVSYIKNPILIMMADAAKVISIVNLPSVSFKVIKDELLSIARALPSVDRESKNIYSEAIQVAITNILENMRKYQYDNKLMESAMVNSAPIVPYSQIIKKPGMDSAAQPVNPYTSNQTFSTINSNLKETSINLPQTILVNNIFDILMRSDEFIKIDDFSFEYNTSDENAKLPPEIISNIIASGETPDYVTVYFTLVYIYYNYKKEDYQQVINFLESAIAIYKRLDSDKIDVKKAVEFFSTLKLPERENSIMSMESIQNMQYHQTRELEKVLDIADIDPSETDDKKYRLDKLITFVIGKRRYSSNEYTNALFLNDNKSISGYSYYTVSDMKFLICEVDDKRLCIPVMDLAENFKLKLIYIDKDENISVTTNFKT